MADFEKLNDDELDQVSGGTKFFVGSPEVRVYGSNGQVKRVLSMYNNDFFVTDGTGVWIEGIYYCHVYLDHGGDGYIASTSF